jgi:hypothetical protein
LEVVNGAAAFAEGVVLVVVVAVPDFFGAGLVAGGVLWVCAEQIRVQAANNAAGKVVFAKSVEKFDMAPGIVLDDC